MGRRSALLAFLSISVLINVALSYRLQQLRNSTRISLLQPLERGEMVSDFDALDLEGAVHRVSYRISPVPTVIYVFMPECAWCARNLDNFRALVAQRGAEFRFVGISLSSGELRPYLIRAKLNIPAYTELSAETQRQYRFGGTPQTLVISPQGRVLQNWMGAYEGFQKWSVEAFFKVKLPGLNSISARPG